MNEGTYGASIGPTQPDQQLVANGNYPMADTQAAMPSRTQNMARPIQIEQLNHGYIVVVGCQRFAIENKDALLHRLGSYLSDPGKVEDEWQSGKLKF